MGNGAAAVTPEGPVPDAEPTLRGLPGYDAVALFAERAAAAVPGFELTEDNMATVCRICSAAGWAAVGDRACGGAVAGYVARADLGAVGRPVHAC